MLNRVKAVIFDLDGTIVDSMWIWEQIDIDFLAKRGIRLPNDLQKAIEGMSFTETAIYFKNRFNLKESIEEIKEEWNAMAYDFYKNRVPLKKGVNEFIKYLKQKNIKLGIGTSNSRELAIEVLKTHNILHYFDTIRTSCEVEKGERVILDNLQEIPSSLQLPLEKHQDTAYLFQLHKMFLWHQRNEVYCEFLTIFMLG